MACDIRARAGNGAMLCLQVLDSPLVPELHMGDKTPHKTGATAYKTYAGQYDFEVGRGWVGRRRNAPIPAPAVTYTGRVRLPVVFTLALVPLAPGADATGLPAIRCEKSGDLTRWHLPSPSGCIILDTSADRFETTNA